MTDPLNAKIISRSEIQSLRAGWSKQGLKVGFTSGVFDLLHAGHASYLARAKEFCDLLVVGVNSDLSVRKNKGPKRPIVPEGDRARLVAALAAVDFVFLFDEQNNETNTTILKPDLYIKAGDYSKEKLSSASIVESYGGKVEIVSMVEGRSSSSIIETIIDRYGDSAPKMVQELKPKTPQPAIFVDRDGTINENIEYLHEPEKFKLIPGALEGLKSLQDAGYRIVVITNQAGIGLGYFSKEDFYRVNRELLKAASKIGLSIDRVYFCPHGKSDGCSCRKPEAGMILRGVEELNVDLGRSFVIGDTTLDLEAARRASCQSILVKTGHGGSDKEFDAKPGFVAQNLAEAAKLIIGQV